MFPELARDDVFRLETRRLWLRWPRAQDAASIAEAASDAKVATRTVDLPHPFPEGAAAELILMARKANSDGRALALAVALKRRPPDAVGALALIPLEDGAAELRFWLGAAHWGKGLMSEAARGVVDLAFSMMKVEEIRAAIPGLNPAALKVCANSGFVAAGSGHWRAPARGGLVPVGIFSLDRHRWSRVHGRRAADAQNAMSVKRADSRM